MPKGVESVKYEGVSFHKADAASKSLAQFQEEQKHHGLTEAQLKEVWQLARGTKEAEDVKQGEVDTTTALGAISGEAVVGKSETDKTAPAKGAKHR